MKALRTISTIVNNYFQPYLYETAANGLSLIKASVSGNGTVIRDEAAALEWLNLRATVGKSFNQVSALCEAGGELDGWRYATHKEARQLYKQFGFNLETAIYPELTDEIRVCIRTMNDYLGETIGWSKAFTDAHYCGSFTLTGTRNSRNNMVTLPVFFHKDGQDSTIDIDGGFSVDSQCSTPFLASLLVRDLAN